MTRLVQLVSFLSHPLVTLLAGCLVTWFFAWLYYRRAGVELRAEADRLQRTNELILRWLETKGENVEIIRDERGRPTGLQHNVSIVESLNISAAITGGELRTIDRDGRA